MENGCFSCSFVCTAEENMTVFIALSKLLKVKCDFCLFCLFVYCHFAVA